MWRQQRQQYRVPCILGTGESCKTDRKKRLRLGPFNHALLKEAKASSFFPLRFACFVCETPVHSVLPSGSSSSGPMRGLWPAACQKVATFFQRSNWLNKACNVQECGLQSKTLRCCVAWLAHGLPVPASS